jgi:hypothetical protein
MADLTSSIGNELAKRTSGGGTENELVFDPGTGELVLKNKNKSIPNPDSTVVDQIAEDGFFMYLIFSQFPY